MDKKIFFILDWDFAYLYAPIAEELVNENIIDSNVNCLNIGRNYYEFMNNGKIKHPFKIIHSLDEVYETKIYDKTNFSVSDQKRLLEEVKILEKEYSNNDNLWQYVWADRNHIKEDYFSIVHKIIVFFKYFEQLYKAENPDLIVTNAYASMPHLISKAVATKLNIKTIVPELLRLEKMTFWSNSKYKLLDKINKNELDISRAKEIISNYRKNFDKPFYEKSNEKRKKNYFGGFKRLLNYSYNYYITNLYTGHTKPNPFKKLINTEIKPRLNKLYFNKFYNFSREKDMHQHIKFLYFPLHLQPEASTMTNAHYYINQLFVIETLSKSIPMNYMLYVKEHPNMFGNNTKYFYDTINSFPNVKLFHPSVDSKIFIKKSEAVVTITGTVGLEGLLLKKPVLTIGEIFYNDCSLVTQLKDIAITKWSTEIKKMLNCYRYDEEIVEQFIAQVISSSYDMLVLEPGYFDDVISEENLDIITKSIENEL